MTLLEVDHLRVTFPRDAGRRAARGADPWGGRVPVVDDLSLAVSEGEWTALVGESGSGKTVTALALMRLVPRPGRIEPGSAIRLSGRDLLRAAVPEMRDIRGREIAMIFQDPASSLNPVLRIGRQVAEAIALHERVRPAEVRARVLSLFERVGIPDAAARYLSYPHELSGGLRQRVMIAMALALRPRLLIADEPTTALDVTIQAQILALLRELQNETGTAILFITHDLAVVSEMADRVAVMYAGKLMEEGPVEEIIARPSHPYTQGLVRSIPRLGGADGRLQEIPGVVPPPEEWPRGCRFASRCPLAFGPCEGEEPPCVTRGPAHRVWCHAVARDMPLLGPGGVRTSGAEAGA